MSRGCLPVAEQYSLLGTQHILGSALQKLTLMYSAVVRLGISDAARYIISEHYKIRTYCFTQSLCRNAHEWPFFELPNIERTYLHVLVESLNHIDK